MPLTIKNINQKENLAFIISDGYRTTSFLKEGNIFFISAGNIIYISPTNLVKSLSTNNGIVTFHFFPEGAQPCKINLLDDIDCMINEYIENFIMVVKEQKQKAGKPFNFLEGLIGFDLPFKLPLITRINIEPFLNKTLKNRIINVSPTGQKSCELIIPENLKISELCSKCYTKVGGFGKSHFLGTRIPIAEYEVSDSGSLIFRDVVKNSVQKLPVLG